MAAVPPSDNDFHDVTSGEVYRALHTFRADVNAAFQELRTQVGALSFVPREQYESDRQATGERLASVEGGVKENRAHNTWLLRTLVGALIVQLVGAVWAFSYLSNVAKGG